MFQGKPSMPPPKLGVMIAVGKPKGEAPAGKPKFSSAGHSEPDADQIGGPSDNDADNRVAENLDLIQQHIPEAIHPIAGLIEAIANYCRGQKSEEQGEGEAGY